MEGPNTKIREGIEELKMRSCALNQQSSLRAGILHFGLLQGTVVYLSGEGVIYTLDRSMGIVLLSQRSTRQRYLECIRGDGSPFRL